MIDAIPSPSWSYYPGLWEQDLYTIPLQAGLLTIMNESYTKAAHPVWPFRFEHTSRERETTRHPGRLLGVYAGGIAVTTLGVLSYAAPNFSLWPHVRGWIHAHLVNELATSVAKQFFLRKRPFYDSEVEKSERGETTVRDDDMRSFFSGHSSHAFTFATYTSLLIGEHAPRYVSVPAAVALYTGASYVAAARAIDGQHNVSDVVVGALVGSVITYAIKARVDDVIAFQKKDDTTAPTQGVRVNIQPTTAVSNGQWITGANVSLEF